ncbi:MAG: YdeI/OmpD-associated family protein [Solirubrobacteraceae bacterium]
MGAIGSISFITTLVPRGPAAAVVLDDEQVAIVGEGAKRSVVATVNGHRWRTTVVRMRGEFSLGLSREVRAGAGAEAGDRVEVSLELDSEPREVEVPEPLALALAGDPQAAAAFERLSFTRRREYAPWIADARRDETRARRVAETLERLRA